MIQDTEQMREQLTATETKIERLQSQQTGGYTSRVSQSFHLGMVGGSGRGTSRLNRIRERELDKTIDRAVILTNLYKERDTLKSKIEYIESGQQQTDAQRKQARTLAKAEYWRRLKVGDELNIGNSNGNPTITKKNAKSVQTGLCTWKAEEVIGREAAALL